MISRVLTVDDDNFAVEDNEQYLRRIPPEESSPVGIEGFVIDTAKCSADALKLLQDAAANDCRYDIIFVDLNLPGNRDDHHHNLEQGFDLLASARRLGAAKMIVAVSAYTRSEVITRAFREGAVDFIEKDYKEDAFQARFLAVWRRLLALESSTRLDQRLKRLIPQAQVVTSSRLGAWLSEFLRNVANEADEIRTELQERLALDFVHDSNDAVVQKLADLQSTVERARCDWKGLVGLAERPAGKDSSDVHELILGLARELEPCFFHRNLKLHLPQKCPDAKVTFQEDASAVLHEILIGSLFSKPDPARSPEIEVSVEQEAQWIRVVARDNLSPLPAEAVEAINRGQPLEPDERFERAWGLSVVQQTALRALGHIAVESSPRGNCITYSLPSA